MHQITYSNCRVLNNQFKINLSLLQLLYLAQQTEKSNIMNLHIHSY